MPKGNDGTLIFDTKIDTKEFEKGIDEIGKIAKTATTAVVGVGAAVTALSTKSVQAYADFEQLTGGIDTLFKSSADTVKMYADNAFQTAAMSANKYMDTVTSFSASLISSLGNDTAKAAQYADSAITDMSDNANKMGSDMERIVQTYQSLSRGNFGMLDNLKLGYGGTREEMERLLADAEKLTGTKFDISNFADITQAIHAIQTEMGITGTTAKEATETISGSLGMVKAAWENLLVATSGGGDIEQRVDEFLDSAEIAAKNLLPAIKTSIEGIGKALMDMSPEIVDYLNEEFDGLADKITVVGTVAGVTYATMKAWTISGAITKGIKDQKKSLNELAAAHLAETAATAKATTADAANAVSEAAGTAATKLHTKAEIEEAVVTGAATGAIGLKQIAIGLLSGQIGVATAAQAAWNAVMVANPIGGVIVAITAAVTALGLLVFWLGKATDSESAEEQKIRELNEASSERIQKLKEETAAMKEREAAYAESATATISEMTHLKSLADELMQLANENGKVAEADKARAEFILGELNKALGSEYSFTGDIINNYKSLQREIYKTIEAKKANLLLESYNDQYTNAIKEQSGLINNQIKAEQDLVEAKAAVAKADAEYQKALDAGIGAFTKLSDYNNAIETLEKLQSEYDDYTNQINENESIIQKYSSASESIIEGKYEEATAILTASDAFVKESKAAEKSNYDLQKVYNLQVREAAAYLENLRFKYSQGVGGVTEGMISQAEKDLETAVELYKGAGGKIVEGADTSARERGVLLTGTITQICHDSVKAAEDALGCDNSYSTEFFKLGEYSADGFIKGIGSKIRAIEIASALMGKTAETAIKDEEEINSPSKVMKDEVGKYLALGVAQGIKENTNAVVESFDAMLDKLERQREFDIINEDEYYTELEKLRDEYFDVGSKEWLDYTQEIYDYQKSMAEDTVESIAKTAEEAFRTIADSKQDLKNELLDYVDMTQEIKIGGWNEDGSEDVFKRLTDYTEANKAIETYADIMKKAHERFISSGYGDIWDEYEKELARLGVDEGTEFGNLLLNATDEQLRTHIEGYKKHQQLSEEVSTGVYADNLEDEFGIQLENAKTKLREAGFDIQDNFFEVGLNSAKEFGKSFLEELNEQLSVVRETISNFSSSLNFGSMLSGGIYGSGGGFGSHVTNNNVSNSFTIGTSKESSAQQISAWRNAQTLERLRST